MIDRLISLGLIKEINQNELDEIIEDNETKNLSVKELRLLYEKSKIEAQKNTIRK